MGEWRDNYKKIAAKRAEIEKYSSVMSVAEQYKATDELNSLINNNYGYLSLAMATELLDKAQQLKIAWRLKDREVIGERASWNDQEMLTALSTVELRMRNALETRTDGPVYGGKSRDKVIGDTIKELLSGSRYFRRAALETIESLKNSGKLRANDLNLETQQELIKAKADLEADRYTAAIKAADEVIKKDEAAYIKSYKDIIEANIALGQGDPTHPFASGELAKTFRRVKFDNAGRPTILSPDDEQVTRVVVRS